MPATVPQATAQWIISIAFVRGWVVFITTTSASGGRNVILRTTQGGGSLQKMTAPQENVASTVGLVVVLSVLQAAPSRWMVTPSMSSVQSVL
jgi:hypothetical protein